MPICLVGMTTDAAAIHTHSHPFENLWPFPATTIGNVAVTDIGRGSPLLFVHVGLWSFIWRDVVQRLKSEFRCIAIDAPGSGRSADVPNVSLEAAADAITNVIDTLDLRELTLIVHDLGGIAGLAAAARRPERIRAIVGVNTFAWKPSRALDTMLRIVGSRFVTAIDVRARIIGRITATAFGVTRRSDQATRAAVAESIDGRALRTFHAYMRDARRAAPLYDEIDGAMRTSLRSLPLLTIFGERNDPFHLQQQWKKRFPQAKQIVVPDGNHFPMCDAPDLVASSIREFLKEN